LHPVRVGSGLDDSPDAVFKREGRVRPQTARSFGHAVPEPFFPLPDQQDFHPPPRLFFPARQPGGDHARVVHDHQVRRVEQVGEIPEGVMRDLSRTPVQDKKF
jgi:hypothetical protein